MNWVDAGPESALEEGQALSLLAGARLIAIVRCEGGVHAIEDLCTHDGAELTGGAIEGCEIVCPRHGARFCLRTGTALTPPAYESVKTFETKLEAGRLWVRVDD
ncbi:MAG TPA: non-heme iron oxygenase ferredoxin subunit [Steroidobacteraceae bacterium]|nr:non-heme iron oxygenase ferredoxin subunit [Steroidobacteraceae bacterium]